jgi:hypothetical protein
MNGPGIAVETPLSVLSHTPYSPGKTIQDYYDEHAFPSSIPVVFVCNDHAVMRADWGRELTSTDRGAFVILPQNGGLKSIIGVVAQIAVTVGVSLLTGNIALGIAAGAAVGAILNLVLQPKISNREGAESSPTYSLTAQGNQARLLNPIPCGYGRHNMFPDFAAQPYTLFQGNDQYLMMLFCRGLGEYDTEEVRVGETVLWRKTTGFTDTFEDTEIEFVEPGQPVTLFPAAVQTSADVTGADLLYNEKIGPYATNAAGTKINRIAYDTSFAGGLFEADKKGKLKRREVAVSTRIRKIDDTGSPLGPWSEIANDLYSASTATAQRYTSLVDVELGRYEIDRVRTNPDATETSISDKVQWAGLRAFEPGSNTYPDVSLMAVRVKATNQLSQQSSRQFNVIQTRKLPIWTGAAWTAPQPTRSIAWATADMLRNPVYGEGRPDRLIDLVKLKQLDTVWSARGDTFNGVFDTKQTFWDALASVLLVGRAQPLLIAGTVTFVRDEPRALAKGVFTPANMIEGSFNTNHVLYVEGTPDDVIVEYVDERTWKQNEVQCTLDGSLSDSPTRIQLFGATNYAHAWREGIYHAAANAYRRLTANLQAEMEGKLLVRGDAVIVSHDMPKWGSSGEVEDYDPTTKTLYLSEPCKWDNGPFYLTFADRRNRQYGPIAVTRGDADDEAVFNPASLAAVEANNGAFAAILNTDPNKLLTRYIHSNSVQFSKRFVTTGLQYQDVARASVSLIVDDPRVYTADLAGAPPEAAASGLGVDPAAPVVVGLRVVIDPASGTSPVLLGVSYQPSRGATGYVAQVSYDGASYDTVYEGTNTAFTFLAQPNALIVRVAAIGSIRGAWAYANYDFTDSGSAPIAVSNLSVYIGYAQSVISAMWDASLRATSYKVQILVEGEVVLEQLTTTTSIDFPSVVLNAAGGPWPNFTLSVVAINLIGTSAATTFVAENAITVAQPTNLSVSTATPAIVSVRSPVDNSWYYIRLYKSTTQNFADAVQINGDIIGGLGQIFSLQDTTAATGFYYFARAFNSANNASAVVGPIAGGASSGGGGGGGGGAGGTCVTDDTLIRMADGSERPARDLRVGDMVETYHEHRLDELGSYPITAISFHDTPVYLCVINGYTVRASALHKFMVDGWKTAKSLGVRCGFATVARITVQDARTYISNGVLSHNIKSLNPNEQEP